MNTAASVKSLTQIKDVTEEDAKLIRAVWKAAGINGVAKVYPESLKIERAFYTARIVKQICIDQILKTHGVEFLGVHKRLGVDVDYCNAGDTYATTVLFIGAILRVGCWGDLVEKNLIRSIQ